MSRALLPAELRRRTFFGPMGTDPATKVTASEPVIAPEFTDTRQWPGSRSFRATVPIPLFLGFSYQPDTNSASMSPPTTSGTVQSKRSP